MKHKKRKCTCGLNKNFRRTLKMLLHIVLKYNGKFGKITMQEATLDSLKMDRNNATTSPKLLSLVTVEIISRYYSGW